MENHSAHAHGHTPQLCHILENKAQTQVRLVKAWGLCQPKLAEEDGGSGKPQESATKTHVVTKAKTEQQAEQNRTKANQGYIVAPKTSNFPPPSWKSHGS